MTLKKKEGTLKLMESTCKENKGEKKMQEKGTFISSHVERCHPLQAIYFMLRHTCYDTEHYQPKE